MRDEFKSNKTNALQNDSIQEIKNSASFLLDDIDSNCPGSREKSIAKTKLEEVVMWAVKSITHNV